MNGDGHAARLPSGTLLTHDQGNPDRGVLTGEGAACLEVLKDRAWRDLTVRQAVILTALQLAARGAVLDPDVVVAALRQKHLPISRSNIPQVWWDEIARLAPRPSASADGAGWAES